MKGKEIWYPADKLTIVDWQVARESVETASGKKMVNEATRKPQANKNRIVGEGLEVLGLKPLQPFYKVCILSPRNSRSADAVRLTHVERNLG